MSDEEASASLGGSSSEEAEEDASSAEEEGEEETPPPPIQLPDRTSRGKRMGTVSVAQSWYCVFPLFRPMLTSL